MFLGNQCIIALKKILEKINDSMSGKIKFNQIEDLLYEFCHNSQTFFYENGTIKSERVACREFELTVHALTQELGKAWNSERYEAEIPDEKEKEIDELEFSSKKSQSDDDKSEIDKEQDLSMHHTKILRFAHVSPKLSLVPEFKCPVCEKAFSYLKSLRRHVNKTHMGTEIDPDLREVVDLITCKMCHRKYQRDLLTRHLVEVHKVIRNDDRGVFRGWISFDGEVWTPLWLSRGEKNPPSEILVPIKGDHAIVYGVEYRVDLLCSGSTPMTPVSSSPIVDSPKITGTNESSKEEHISKHVNKVVDEIMSSSPLCHLHSSPCSNVKPNSGFAFSKRLKPLVARQLNFDGLEVDKTNDDDNLLPFDEEEFEDMDTDVMNEENPTDVNEENQTATVLEDSSLFKTPYDQIVNTSSIIDDTLPILKVKVITVRKEDRIEDIFDQSSSDLMEYEIDSEHDVDDDQEYTESRIEMKKIRLKRRNDIETKDRLVDLEANKSVISQFDKWNSNKLARGISTLRKIKGHLFHYEDSLLNFMSTKYDEYSLRRHIIPLHDTFLPVSDPTLPDGWLKSISGPSGLEDVGRQKEALKAHSRWREFVADMMLTINFGAEPKDYLKRECILNGLKAITDKIRDKKMFHTLTQMEDQRRRSKLKARKIVFPSNNFLEQQCCSLWFKSKNAKDEEDRNSKIYDKAVSGSKITNKEFNQFALWVRFCVCLIDKNRRGVYSFSNLEFCERCPKWFPPVDDKVENDNSIVERFESIPEGWNPDEPPAMGLDPTCWVICRSGMNPGMKKGQQAEIILTRYSLNICLKYRELKDVMLGHDLEPEANFFVNAKGENLGEMRRSKQSLLAKLEETVGVNSPTINTLRRGSEKIVQENINLVAMVDNIQGHSRTVGSRHYDRFGESRRANFIQQLEKVENDDQDIDVPESVKEQRKYRDEKDMKEVVKIAKEKLEVDKIKKAAGVKTNFKIKPMDRDFMQKLFSETDAIDNKKEFPKDDAWVKVFYRYVDTREDEKGDTLRAIEESVFIEYAKKEIEKKFGPWTGSKSDNKKADLIIALYIKTCFREAIKKVKRENLGTCPTLNLPPSPLGYLGT